VRTFGSGSAGFVVVNPETGGESRRRYHGKVNLLI
jgi:hypothetical protein